MNAKDHLRVGTYSLAVFIIGHYTNHIAIDYNDIIQIVVGVGVGTLLPDIDHRESILGSIIPLWKLNDISKNIRKKKSIFRHGGITHTIFVNAWIFIIGYLISNYLIVAISFGYATHLYFDHITGNKLPMLWWPVGIEEDLKILLKGRK